MHNKENLRKHFFSIRKKCDKKSEKIITDYFLSGDEYKYAKTIFAYYPIGSEFDTLPIIKKAIADKKTIALPKCNPENHSMKFIEINSTKKGLLKGSYNIPEPVGDAESDKVPDIIIVPALSCDLSGNRLGYGGGYYDRYLKNLKSVKKIVLMHKEQISEKLPKDNTDIPIDIIITEGGYIRII